MRVDWLINFVNNLKPRVDKGRWEWLLTAALSVRLPNKLDTNPSHLVWCYCFLSDQSLTPLLTHLLWETYVCEVAAILQVEYSTLCCPSPATLISMLIDFLRDIAGVTVAQHTCNPHASKLIYGDTGATSSASKTIHTKCVYASMQLYGW